MENMGMGGRPAYTVEETRLAMEWREKSLALGEKYNDELTAVGDDCDKKRPIVKLIYEEVGPVPLPIKITMSPGLPIVILLLKYEKELEEAERIRSLIRMMHGNAVAAKALIPANTARNAAL